jgi:hypothetical protein
MEYKPILSRYFFKVLSIYFEARIRIRVKGEGRIRIRIKQTSRIRIQSRIKVMRIRNTGQDPDPLDSKKLSFGVVYT